MSGFSQDFFVPATVGSIVGFSVAEVLLNRTSLSPAVCGMAHAGSFMAVGGLAYALLHPSKSAGPSTLISSACNDGNLQSPNLRSR